ncbi:MAG: AI-2E family transporter [Bacteroidota bacterium]|nr:AI-2E family transporter [Bacteroidota bacterium]
MTATGKELQLPFYAKASLILIGLYVLINMLYIAQDIIVPLVFAVIISIVLHPVVNFFVRKKINRIVSIVITIFLTFIIIGSIATLLISQASQFSQSWPMLVEKFTGILNQTVSAASGYTDISPEAINEYIDKGKDEMLNVGKAAIGETLITIGGIILVLLLVPVYVFIILFYHSLLIEFIHKVFGRSDQSQVSAIVSETKTVIQLYLVGLIIEAAIIAVLNSVALLALGIEYAILIGIIGALLNVIPYIGGLVAVALPMIVALATKSSGMYAVYVLIVYYIIQLIDNNYIVPIIVSSKVKINALFSIIVVFAGNALWGISGMFLSIPLLAIIKLIFDHIEPLKPWGFLLGDTMPSLLKMKPFTRKTKLS